ncbi:MAG: hypothetical protein LBM71_01955 [Elusimicrobiota bacterium]|jgi:hypothetical protein|nr:hypothetical protein [Elusimicrobiota bacterium]
MAKDIKKGRMKKILIVFCAICCFAAAAFAAQKDGAKGKGEEEHYGVFIQTSNPQPASSKQTAQTASKDKDATIPLPKNPRQDDDFLSTANPNLRYKYKICVKGQIVQYASYNNPAKDKHGNYIYKQYPDEIEEKQITQCRDYYALGDEKSKKQILSAAANRASQNMQNIEDIAIVSATAVNGQGHEIKASQLSQMQTGSMGSSYKLGEGVIYKKILTSKKKIDELTSYTYLQLSVKARALMATQQDSEALPIRISVYQYQNGNAWAVIVFDENRKYFAQVNDMSQDATIYDLKPDFGVKYTTQNKP